VLIEPQFKETSMPLACGHQPPVLVAFTVTVTHPATEVTLVDLAGELDSLTSPCLNEHLDQQLGDPLHPALILNSSHLSFFSGAGLACLVRAGELADRQHNRLYLVPGPLVGRLLRLFDLQDQFVTCPDLTSALAAAAAGTAARESLTRSPTPTGPVAGCAVIHPVRES
jgi:anti-anti-sigma factor